MILDDIVAKKSEYLKNKKIKLPFNEIRKQAQSVSAVTGGFKSALESGQGISIIGEIKKASPSKGLIRSDFDPVFLAKEYEKASVQALSVLTERDFFLGDESYIGLAKKNCRLPVLRKDFIIDEWQIYESRLLEADAILLIAAILDLQELADFIELANVLGIDALVEVHNEKELDNVLRSDAQIIGINNRDLNDFTVSLETTKRLSKLIPPEKVTVGESGIHSRDDVKLMESYGVDALLIGEMFMRAENIKEAVDEIRGGL